MIIWKHFGFHSAGQMDKKNCQNKTTSNVRDSNNNLLYRKWILAISSGVANSWCQQKKIPIPCLCQNPPFCLGLFVVYKSFWNKISHLAWNIIFPCLWSDYSLNDTLGIVHGFSRLWGLLGVTFITQTGRYCSRKTTVNSRLKFFVGRCFNIICYDCKEK